MNTTKVVSIVVLVVGIVILVVLTTLGGVAKQTIHDSVISRLKYKLPEGAPEAELCYRATKARFYEEYYLWNLTNGDAFLNGAKPVFNLTGPFCYTQWYCQYNHSINKETGYLQYRTYYDGYFFLKDDSVSNDDVKITNINPGYLGVLSISPDDSQLVAAVCAPALRQIIENLQKPEIVKLFWYGSIANVFGNVTKGILDNTAYQQAAAKISTFTETQFFDSGFSGSDIEGGWAYHTIMQNPSANVTVSSTAQAQLFAVFSSATELKAFAAKSASTIASEYGVEADQGESLVAYTAYVRNSEWVVETTNSIVYNDWANSSATGYPEGWQAGNPTPTGLSNSDVAALFDTAGTCSLTNFAGMKNWIKVIQNAAALSDACPGVFTMSDTQRLQVLAWMDTYASSVVSSTLATQWSLPTWNDFAFAQWGSGIAGFSLSDLQGIVGYKPEAYNAPGIWPTKINIPLANAKELLLNETNGLLQVANMVSFLSYSSVGDQSNITAKWPAFGANASPFSINYVRDTLIPRYATPLLSDTIKQGGGLVTTRSVREWLFTGEDPLLKLLNQSASVAMVGNLTRTKEESKNFNYTYYRVYTGHNDLHWSLMPYNNGTVLDFWNSTAGTEFITGYNGTQFLPNGYLDQEIKPIDKPLVLFHRLINRTIPFQVKGKDKWEDVHVRYLTISDNALASGREYSHNYLYFAQYSGVVNKTSNPPKLPIFLTTPNFLSAEPAFYQNIEFSDKIFPDYNPNEKLSTHRLALFLLAEPTLGSTLWGNLPIQVNFQVGRTNAFPNIQNVTAFAPIYWNAIGDKATTKDLDDVKGTLYTAQTAWKALIGVGVGVGVLMIAGGAAGLIYLRIQKGSKVPNSP